MSQVKQERYSPRMMHDLTLTQLETLNNNIPISRCSFRVRIGQHCGTADFSCYSCSLSFKFNFDHLFSAQEEAFKF